MTSFPDNGEGWFETNLGYSASSLVKRLKKARRHNKDNRDFIDKAIEDVRSLKAMEMDATLKMHDWSIKHSDTIRDIGVNDKDMRALRKFGDSRKVSLQRACHQWERAEDTLKMLEEYEDVWSDEQKKSWVDAMQAKRDARKVWKTTLNQMERLTNKEKEALRKSADILQERGQMTGRTIHENLMEKGVLHNSMTAMKLSKLLSMYGEEVDVISGNQRSTFVKMDKTGLIIKDPWAYAAGFLDADGYITITKRGEPRAGFIATGARGKIHCEQLQKTLGCGVLQLDQKVYSDTQRSQHRLQFYSKADIHKLLKGILPFLEMKKTQAKAVLAYLEEPDSLRKNELLKVVRYHNWSDDTKKATALLDEWGVQADDVAKWAEAI
tara:strand:+ start:2802 stop:3944 length:1143 start_codon:yes stop_codon:yes gene_type:complete